MQHRVFIHDLKHIMAILSKQKNEKRHKPLKNEKPIQKTKQTMLSLCGSSFN